MMMNSNAPIKEHEQEGSDIDDGYEETATANGCSCFRLFCFGWRRSNDGEDRCLLQQKGEHKEETWLVTKLKKVKEVSELLAGPKWKNFLRRFSKYFNKNKRGRRRTQFQYDPHSYALNFDNGIDEEEDGLLPTGFSSRFAAPFSSEEPRVGL